MAISCFYGERKLSITRTCQRCSVTEEKTSACPGKKGNKAHQMESPLGHMLYYFERRKTNTTVLLRKKKFSSYLSSVASGRNSEKNYFQQQQQKSKFSQLPIRWQLLINTHLRNPHPTRPGCWEERSKGFSSLFTLFVHYIPRLPSSYIAYCVQ